MTRERERVGALATDVTVAGVTVGAHGALDSSQMRAVASFGVNGMVGVSQRATTMSKRGSSVSGGSNGK
jgi:hypothetical protein